MKIVFQGRPWNFSCTCALCIICMSLAHVHSASSTCLLHMCTLHHLHVSCTCALCIIYMSLAHVHSASSTCLLHMCTLHHLHVSCTCALCIIYMSLAHVHSVASTHVWSLKLTFLKTLTHSQQRLREGWLVFCFSLNLYCFGHSVHINSCERQLLSVDTLET